MAASNRYSCTVECSKCSKRFKSSGTTWRHMLKSHQLAIQPVQFLDQNDRPVPIKEPKYIVCQSTDYASYTEWLATIQERLNEALHPALPGRWIRVEDPCVPEDFVLHFVARILEQTDQVMSPHSIKYLSHRSLPYRLSTQRISYRVYEIGALKDALEEQKVVGLCKSVAFWFHNKVETVGNTALTMKEKIARMKALACGTLYPERAELPTSRSSLVVSVGEGRSTREAEIIYWPNLYTISNRCKFQLHFFIQKCELQ